MVTDLTRKVINEKAKVISLHQIPEVKEKKERAPRKSTVIEWEQEKCPKCKDQHLMKGKTAIGCSDFKIAVSKFLLFCLVRKLPKNKYRI